MIKSKNFKKFSAYVLALVLSVCMASVLCGCGDKEKSVGNSTADSPDKSDSAVLDEKLTYYADIDIKDYGTVTVKLEQSSAPITCANFVDLANSVSIINSKRTG